MTEHSVTPTFGKGCPWLVALLLLGCTLASLGQQAAPPFRGQAVKEQRPVALDVLPSGILTVLESRGGLSLLRPGATSLTPVKETVGRLAPIDLVAARVKGEERVFVTMYSTSAAQVQQYRQTNQGLLVEYSLQGEEVQRWSRPGRALAGLAVDPDKLLIYVADPVSAEVSVVGLFQEDKEPRFLVSVAGASKLGPLALDAPNQRLFASDIADGKIYVVDLARKRSRLLVSSLGEPAGLAYDPRRRRLYVADAAKRCIWQIQVDLAKPQARRFSSAPELREPRGVAVGPGGAVWVADYGAGAVFRLSATGRVEATIRR